MSMKDPIGIYENLKQQYFKYIDTAFSVDDLDFKTKRKEVYLPDGKDSNNILAQEPYLELIKPYPSSDNKITDIKIEDIKDASGNNYFSNQEELELFQNFCKAGLVGDFPLYQHQIDMIKNYALGKNCIITTGTGSGKTEAFLLPLFAYLSKQITKWKEIPEPPLDFNWFNYPARHTENGTAHYKAQAQRKNSTRKPSIKAIILYPMNALVDDQMTRLRKALDSTASEEFYNDYCGNHRVYFGQYNGATPISADINEGNNTQKQKKQNELREKLNELQLYWNKIQSVIDNGTLTADQIEDIIYTSQKIGGSELLTRFDMQATPPDIFITNYSMLNIMLMRDREDSIFDKTKEWLEEDKNNIFHLIVDELHLNRGSSGTELALLLRLVEYRLGLSPGHPQLRILASSASLDPQDPESKDYITDFFGMDFTEHFKIVKEETVVDSGNEAPISKESLEKFQNLCEQENQNKTDEKIAEEIFGDDFLIKNTNQLKQTLLKGFENKEGKHTFSLTDVNNKLFGDEGDFSALKGLLKLRAIYDDSKYKGVKGNLPRIRFHLFFKNIDDLHTLAGEKDRIVFNSSKTKIEGKKVFQNLYCDECGTVFYGGRRYDNNGGLEMLPISSEYENMPDLNLDKRPEYLSHSEFIVFWPNKLLGKELNDESKEFKEVNRLEGSWNKAFLHINKGTISLNRSDESKPEYLSGYIYRVNDKKSKSLPCQCPQCAQTYIYKKFMKSPVRTFRTGYSQVTQVLASSLLKQLSPNEVDNRKLLIFSDSRSAAADLANKLERNNYSDVLRKNVFRLGLINDADIRTEVDDFFISRDESDWKWGNLSQDVQKFCNINFPNKIDDLNEDNGIIFKNTLIVKCFDKMVGSNMKTIPIKNLMPTRDNPGLLFKEFIETGINPVGNDYNFQKSKDGKGELNWYDIFNLENGQFNNDKIQGPEGSELYSKLQKEFSEQICNVLFGRHQFAIETMAKGYISFPEDQLDLIFSKLRDSDVSLSPEINQILKEMVNSLIRIFGYKFRHIGSTYAPQNNYSNIISFNNLKATSAYRKYIDMVFKNNEELNSINKVSFVNSFLNTLNDFNPAKQFSTGIFQPYIDPTYFKITHLNQDDKVYKCSNCGANHGHFSAGVCSHCFSPLDINNYSKAKDVWAENFYANIEVPIRMHTEELTGQTDSSDAKNRQKAFKNIFLDSNTSSKKAEQIDVLSVTTTMEVGVDIGSLEATMMANMPPERYNYQQRVGRAGRGGQAYSIALTLCRGNSHDSYYYSNLDGMVNAKPPTPFIPMELNSDISKRIFYKEILRSVFKLKGIGNVLMSEDPPEKFQDTHGEFGSFDDFKNELSISKTDFVTEINLLLVNEDIISLANHLNFSPDYFEANFNGVKIYNEIFVKLRDLEIKPIGLAECLAEAGLLPMYGMPTRTRSLYHNYKNGNFSTMSRDLEMAISEYAPGNEITKDKKIFKVEGITSPITKRKNLTQYDVKPIDDNLFYYQLNKDGSISTEKDTLIEDFANEDWESINNSGRKIGVIPKAYITKLYPEENTSAIKPYFSVSIPRILSGGGNVKWDTFNNLDSYLHQGHIMSFNEGENYDGFNFDLPKPIFKNTTDLLKTEIAKEESQSVLNYNLASNKFTSLLQIKPHKIYYGLQLCCEQMNDQQADYEIYDFVLQGVKSSVFSAAFLLRSVFTQQQDVDNSELEVLGLRHYTNEDGSKVTGFSYGDKLSNGSGFSQKLNDNLSNYINLCLDPTGNFNGEIIQFVIDLLSKENQENCDVADYTNLLNYRNKRFHPLLNWRLGVSYLRILRGKEDEIEKVINADSSLPEFGAFYGKETWLEGVGAQLEEFKEEYNINSELITDFVLPFLQCEAPFENKIIIPYHPLWHKESLHNNPIIKEILDELDNEEIIYIDSFNLANRPGDCYEKLIKNRNQTEPNWDVLN
jgi:DEAD/DEAH box helicase domain-containing protein